MTQQTQELLDQVSMMHRLTRAGVKIDGDKFNPALFPWLVELYDRAIPWSQEPCDIAIRKGSQVGWTSWAILQAIYRAESLYPRGVLYTFPSEKEVYDFARSRFARILRDNEAVFGKLVHDTDSVLLKRIGPCFLYFRGAQSTKRMLSIPCDFWIGDEYDEMSPEKAAECEERLGQSLFKHIVRFGHPSLPDYQIDALYKDSDQRVWMIRCEACNAYTCLELEFPDCIQARAPDSHTAPDWYRACVKCSREIYPKDGEWVPTTPEVDYRKGYWMSQLLSTRRNLGRIMQRHAAIESTGRDLNGGPPRTFWNLVMGKPYVDLDDALELEHVYRLCLKDVDAAPERAHEGPSAMGADVGAKWIYACFGTKPVEERFRVRRFVRLASFDELAQLCKAFHVQVGVVDQMAEARSVRDFVKKTSGCWGQYYSDGQKHTYKWDPVQRTVTVNRTESIDDSHTMMLEAEIDFPRMTEFFRDEVAPQLINLVRVRDEHDDTGAVKTAWHVRGVKNDHFRHALNSFKVAASRLGVERATMVARNRRQRDRGGASRSWQAQ